jgi:hypothetical protein
LWAPAPVIHLAAKNPRHVPPPPVGPTVPAVNAPPATAVFKGCQTESSGGEAAIARRQTSATPLLTGTNGLSLPPAVGS